MKLQVAYSVATRRNTMIATAQRRKSVNGATTAQRRRNDDATRGDATLRHRQRCGCCVVVVDVRSMFDVRCSMVLSPRHRCTTITKQNQRQSDSQSLPDESHRSSWSLVVEVGVDVFCAHCETMNLAVQPSTCLDTASTF